MLKLQYVTRSLPNSKPRCILLMVSLSILGYRPSVRHNFKLLMNDGLKLDDSIVETLQVVWYTQSLYIYLVVDFGHVDWTDRIHWLVLVDSFSCSVSAHHRSYRSGAVSTLAKSEGSQSRSDTGVFVHPFTWSIGPAGDDRTSFTVRYLN